MRRRNAFPVVLLSVALCLLLVLTLSGCYEPGGPIPANPGAPSPRAWTTQQVDSLVTMKEESIYSPAPRVNGTPPPEADYIRFLRYKLKDSSENASDADAILLLMPGILCGSDAFDYIGRELVYMAKTEKNLNIEVWGTERRPNRVEDMTGVEAAEAAHDTNVAIDYYYHGSVIDGKKFAGFLTDRDAPYLSEFGLELAMRDVYTIITTMVPDPNVRRQKLFVGGHSLGGVLTAFFAGWDFDGNPATTDDAGYRNCAGFVALDSTIATSFAGSQSKETLEDALPKAIQSEAPQMSDEEFYSTVLTNMRKGDAPRILPIPAITPEAEMLLELLGMEANWAPDAESTLLKRVPFSDSVDNLLKLLNSRTVDAYFVNVPGVRDFRFTNEAALGTMLDDNFMPVSIIQASMGFTNGGAVVVKDFPVPASISQAPLFQDLFGGFYSKDRLFIANDAGPSVYQLRTGPLYGWTNYDEFGTPADPDYRSTDGSLTYTSAADEVSDIQDVARTLYRGPSNLPEWYFTMRLMLDIALAPKPFAPKYGLNFMHGDHINDLPKVEFQAEKGPMGGAFGFEQASPVPKIRGYNHLDVLTAAANTPSRRPNEVFGPLIDWIIKNRPALTAQPAAGTRKKVAPRPASRKK